METNILKMINDEKMSFENKDIQIVPGLTFNQKQTIEQIYFYYNSKFQSGEIDGDGDKKYFYNINKNPCKIFSKAIDFDTKNIRLLTADGGNPLKTWFMERDLKFWMKDKQFGRVLNRIFYELPIFGSVVLKAINGNLYFVDLRNFVVEQSADTLEDANYIIEKHPYTVAGFRKAMKEFGVEQKKIDETIKLYREMPDVKHIMVYERYGEVETNGKWEYRRVYIADVGVDQEDQMTHRTIPYRGIELKSDVVEENPYWEFHLEKIPGRWLGIGVVETLFEPQINTNESENLLSKASGFRAIVLLKSADPGFAGKNLLTEARNGDVLDTSEGDINQLNIQDVNLGHFNDRHNRWMKNRDELTFSYDVVQGERLPAGTPLGSAQIAISQTLSYFETIQETIAMDVKEMIFKVILPQWENESSTEHTIRLVGKDLDAYISMIKDGLVAEEVIKQVIKGKFPSEYDAQVIGIVIENGIKKNGELLKQIPKGFYKDTKYDIDIDITGESVDTRVRNATKFAILQAIQADPMMLQDPTKKKILFSVAEDGGIDLNDFVAQDKQSIEQQMTGAMAQRPGGGGVSRPQMTQGAMPGTKTSTI
ncbi:MAG: hypothetical protein WC735_04705 [Candidatus Paceibacterota bacterium]